MTTKQKLEIRSGEIRSRLNELSGKEEMNDSERKEINDLSTEYKDVELRMKASIIGEDEVELKPEERELNDLTSKIELRNYFNATLNNSQISGAEKEFNEEKGITSDLGTAVPWEAFVVEERTDTPVNVPSTQNSSNRESILSRVFNRTAASWAGVSFPSVGVGEREYPIMATGTSAEWKAKNAEVDANAATFTITSVSPTRLTARYLFTYEDVALFNGLENALRNDLSQVMADQLDKSIFTGNGTSPNPNGIFNTAITAPTAASAVATNGTYINSITGMVDGKWANSPGQVRILIGPETFRHMASLFLTNTDTSALEQVSSISGGYRVSDNIKAAASSKREALLIRPGGIAVAPIWPAVSLIRDPYTNAAKGQVAITTIALYGFKVVRSDGFKRVDFQYA